VDRAAAWFQRWAVTKGGPGSGHWGHAGRPGRHGGSAPGGGSVSDRVAQTAAEFISSAMLSSKLIKPTETLPSETREFLHRSVEDKPYKLYRGLGIVRGRVDPDVVNSLKAGDNVPSELLGKVGISVPYTKSKGVARYYSEGTVSIVIEATVPPQSVLADLENLPELFRNTGQDVLDELDFEYFREDKEVLVDGPVGSAKILSIKGRL